MSRCRAELSVVAFDDSVLARLMHPSLTALSRDTFALGQRVADLLLQVIEEPGSVANVQMPTPTLHRPGEHRRPAPPTGTWRLR